MKLDMSKPYGTIYGNTAAMYEQNGQCFGGNGEPVEPTDLSEEAEAETSVQQWLCELLSGGPMTESNVFKACEDAGKPWPEVKTAHGVRKYRYRGADMWKLAPN